MCANWRATPWAGRSAAQKWNEQIATYTVEQPPRDMTAKQESLPDVQIERSQETAQWRLDYAKPNLSDATGGGASADGTGEEHQFKDKPGQCPREEKPAQSRQSAQ